jgi:hypothetical protein
MMQCHVRNADMRGPWREIPSFCLCEHPLGVANFAAKVMAADRRAARTLVPLNFTSIYTVAFTKRSRRRTDAGRGSRDLEVRDGPELSLSRETNHAYLHHQRREPSV